MPALYYIGVQLLGFVGTAAFFFSYQFQDNKRLFQMQFLSYLLYTIHLLALGAITGGISYVINTLRSLCLGSNLKCVKTKKMCTLICLMQVGALVFTWQGPLSILPVFGNIVSTIAGYTFSGKKIRLAGMVVNSPLWLIYNISVGSLAGIFDELICEASVIVSIVRIGWDNMDKETESKDNNTQKKTKELHRNRKRVLEA